MRMTARRQKVMDPGERFLLLLDYDGTLAPICPRPEQAVLAAGTRTLLCRLSRRHQVVLLSGRDVASLRRLARPGKRVGLVGTHGAEAANLGGFRLLSLGRMRRLRSELSVILKALKAEFGGNPRLQIEAKTVSVALHYRRARVSPWEELDLRKRFRRCVGRTGKGKNWNFQEGKKMIDLRPRGFDKGKAVKTLCQRFPDLRPLVAGDDLTDLAAFRAVGPSGVRVAVGSALRGERCDRWLPSVSAFRRYLLGLV
jgi:trehalose 6-phosphate phosphatase